jgi:hypothetical protein
MGLAGQARVRELFDLEQSADQLAALLIGRWAPACTGSTDQH